MIEMQALTAQMKVPDERRNLRIEKLHLVSQAEELLSIRAGHKATLDIKEEKIGAHKSEGGAGPFAGVSSGRHSRKELTTSGLALTILAEARAGKNSKDRPVENGREAIQKAAGVLTSQDHHVMPEGVEHGRRVGLLLIFGLLPLTALVNGFRYEWVKSGLTRQ